MTPGCQLPPPSRRSEGSSASPSVAGPAPAHGDHSAVRVARSGDHGCGDDLVAHRPDVRGHDVDRRSGPTAGRVAKRRQFPRPSASDRTPVSGRHRLPRTRKNRRARRGRRALLRILDREFRRADHRLATGPAAGISVRQSAEPMREWSPYGQLDTPHLHGFMVSREGEFVLEELPNGETRLTGKTWYQHHLWPAAY